MSKYKTAVASQSAHIKSLLGVIAVLSLALFWALNGWSKAPEHIKIDIPPDLRSGSTRGIAERHPFNVYAFGYYVFQQLNNWPTNGVDDFKNNIYAFSCYFTPNYLNELERDYDRRRANHELNRTRGIQEMIGHGYKPSRIYTESKESWIAYYDLNVKETFRSEVIKNIFARYPIRIVAYDVDPECNLWGLAIDGFYGEPKRLEQSYQTDYEKLVGEEQSQ